MSVSARVVFGAIVSVIAGCASAQASVLYDWSFTSGVNTVASGTFTTDAAAATEAGNVTDFTGQFAGSPITGFVLNPTPGVEHISPLGAFNYDDLFDPNNPQYLTNHGIVFNINSDTTVEYNIFALSPTGAEVIGSQNGAQGDIGTLTVDADVETQGPPPGGIPEPSEWFLLLAGFLSLGSAVRFMNRKPALLRFS
jgi:hypothetical protein